MNGLIMAAQLMMGLAILVILHELGHYLSARFFGIRVEKFYLFFDAWGFKLFSFKRGDTEYGIGWLPLGGYVKIAGMIDESMDKAQLAAPPKPDEFRSKPSWQRLIVMVSGVTVNVLLGIFIFWMLTLRYGEPYTPISEWSYGIVPGKALSQIGFKPGDKITMIGDKKVERSTDLTSSEFLYGNIPVTVLRGSETVKIQMPGNFIDKIPDNGTKEDLLVPRMRAVVDSFPEGSASYAAGLRKGDEIVAIGPMAAGNAPLGLIHTEFFDQLQNALQRLKGKKIAVYVNRQQKTIPLAIQLDAAGKIGFFNRFPDFHIQIEKFSFFAALRKGSSTALSAVTDDAKGIMKVLRGEVKPSKALTGPIGIAKIYGSHIDWDRFWRITAVLSMVLAFVNILPIPALDGGHALFLIIEMVKGSPLSEKFLENAQIVGFFILISLMVFIFGNDILKLIHNR